jgi:hypothetical protein
VSGVMPITPAAMTSTGTIRKSVNAVARKKP